MTKVAVLEAGVLPKEMAADHGRYADMFEAILAPLDEALSFKSYAAVNGELPSDPANYQSYIVTGSAQGVYERESWMKSLQEFIHQANDVGARILGICFGHQLLADAFGGVVQKVDKGWGIGVHDYEVHQSMPWMCDANKNYSVFASHQDQVVVKPENATLLAGSEFCPNGMLKIGENILTMQCHPEMPHHFAHDLLESRRERIGPEYVDRAQATLGGTCDRMKVSQWIVDFLKNGH